MECLICQVSNSGQHFGVSCCRACSAFFRRTIQLKLKYTCRFQNNCDVTNKNRYSCRACRVARCYALGMGNHDNARKEINKRRCSTEQYVPEEGPSSSEHSLENFGFNPYRELSKQAEISMDIATLIKVKLDQLFRTPKQRSNPDTKPVQLCDQAMHAWHKHNANWPNCAAGKLIHTVVVDLNAFMQANYAEVEHVATFCMSISVFAQLPMQQKWFIFKHFWPRFVELDRTFVSALLLGNDRNDGRMVNFDGTVVNFSCHGVIGDLPVMSDMTESQIRCLLEQSVINTKKVFADPFKLFEPDQFEVMYMMMSVMWNVKDIVGLNEATMLLGESIQKSLAEELQNYYISTKFNSNYASRLYRIYHLLNGLDKVSTIRKEDGYMSRTFNVFKQDIFLNDLK